MASMNNLTTLIKRYAFCSVPQDRLVALQLLRPLRSPARSPPYQPSADRPDQAGSCHLPLGGHGADHDRPISCVKRDGFIARVRSHCAGR